MNAYHVPGPQQFIRAYTDVQEHIGSNVLGAHRSRKRDMFKIFEL